MDDRFVVPDEYVVRKPAVTVDEVFLSRMGDEGVNQDGDIGAPWRFHPRHGQVADVESASAVWKAEDDRVPRAVVPQRVDVNADGSIQQALPTRRKLLVGADHIRDEGVSSGRRKSHGLEQCVPRRVGARGRVRMPAPGVRSRRTIRAATNDLHVPALGMGGEIPLLRMRLR